MSTPTLRFRQRTEEPGDAVEVEEKIAPLAWTGGAARATTAITWSLIASLIAGPLALLGLGWVVFASATAPAPIPVLAGETAKTVNQRAAVASFAEDFTLTWLTSTAGEEKALTAFLADTSGATLPKTPLTATDPSVSGIATTDAGTWSVTVAVTVTAAPDQPGVRRYFQIPVIAADGALVATAFPTPVAGPPRAEAPRLGYRNRTTSADPAAVAVGEFLNALLAGAGDVTRFVSPGAEIRAIAPAPYASVALGDVFVDRDRSQATTTPKTGEQLHVLAQAVATVTRDQQITVTYALTLTARAGRWEVTAIDPAPRLQSTGSAPESETWAPSESSSTSPNPTTAS